LFLFALASLVLNLFEARNERILNQCYDLGSTLEARLSVETQGIFTRISRDRTYSKVLPWLFGMAAALAAVGGLSVVVAAVV
jgi:hypothetical protein